MMFQFMGMGLQHVGCKSLVSLGFRYFTSKLNCKQPGIETARPGGKEPPRPGLCGRRRNRDRGEPEQRGFDLTNEGILCTKAISVGYAMLSNAKPCDSWWLHIPVILSYSIKRHGKRGYDSPRDSVLFGNSYRDGIPIIRL